MISTIFLSCSDTDDRHSDLLTRERLIVKHFNKYQRADLEKVLQFFTEEICEFVQLPLSNAADCYQQYLDRLAESGSFGRLDLSIPIDRQDSMLNTIYKVTYEGVWEERETSALGQFGIRYGGNFHSFLTALAKEQQSLKQYSDTFEQAGALSPSMIADMLTRYDQYDLADPRIQLVITVHYLTLNKMIYATEEGHEEHEE